MSEDDPGQGETRGRRFCANCGFALHQTANFCPNCGAAQEPTVEVQPGPPPPTPESGRIRTPDVPGVPPPPQQAQQPITVTVTQQASQRQFGCGTGCGTGCLAIVLGLAILGIVGTILGTLGGEYGREAQILGWIAVPIVALIGLGAIAIVIEARNPGFWRRTMNQFLGRSSSPTGAQMREPNYGRPSPPGEPRSRAVEASDEEGQRMNRGAWHPHPDDPPPEEERQD